MDWINDESLRFSCPSFADEFVGRESFEGFEAPPEIVGVDEVLEMAAQLVMVVVVEPFDGCVLDGPVHSLNLPVCPRMTWLGQAMLDIEIGTCRLESVTPD